MWDCMDQSWLLETSIEYRELLQISRGNRFKNTGVWQVMVEIHSVLHELLNHAVTSTERKPASPDPLEFISEVPFTKCQQFKQEAKNACCWC